MGTPLTDGDDANEGTFNSAFMSRVGDTDTTGKVNLTKTTEAGADDGALRVQGGIYVAKSIYSVKGLALKGANDSTTTGASADATLVNPFTLFTNASLTSIRNLVWAPTAFAHLIVLKNSTGAALTIVNNSGGTAANRILTGTGANLVVSNGACIFLIYDYVNSRWAIVGGSGGSGSSPAGTDFTVTNNSAAQTVTGLIFDKTVIRSSRFEWAAYRKSTGGSGIRVQTGQCMVIHDDTNWALSYGAMSGVDAGITFAIDATTGQVTLDADDNGGTPVTNKITWEIVNTKGL